VLFGVVAFRDLALDLLPDIAYPSLTIRTEFPDTAPGEVENLVTRPIEESVGVMRGLQEIHSVTRSGSSEVTLQFGWGADMNDLSLEVREKLDRVTLPEEAEAPIVLRYDPALDPILRLALTGSDDLALLRRVAEKEVKESLETRDGIAAAEVKGGVEEEIQIDVDQGKLSSIGVSIEELGRVLTTSNVNRPGGQLESTESQYLVRTLNEFDSVEEIAELTITPAGRAPVRLADVAEVTRGAKEREEITRVNGKESVEIAIYKEGDANTVAAADAVEEALPFIRDDLPPGMELTTLFDQARFVRRAVNEVRDALLIGGLLAILVLAFFLRDGRPTMIIAVSIPLSIVATFILMYRLDVSLNIMSLGGLTLGIGMLVDASIVVLEAVHRRYLAGASRARAAVEGTSEVAGAVIASVLTTVAVFFPIVFVEGIAGQLFRDQALTVTFSLAASLVVALSLIPMLSSLGGKEDKEDLGQAAAETLESTEADHTLGAFSARYERLLRGALDHRKLTLGVAMLLFALSCLAVPRIGRELIPTLSEGEFHFEAVLPEGTPLAATDRAIQRMEAVAAGRPEVETVFATVGSRLVAGGLSLKTKDENLGQVNVVMKNRADDALEESVATDLRAIFERIPSLLVKLGRPSFFSLKTPVELVFFGDDLEELRDYSLDLLPKVTTVPGIADVRASLEAGSPELTVRFDRDRLAAYDLTIDDVSTRLRDRVQGSIASRFRESDRHIDIRVRNRVEDRDTVTDVQNLIVAERGGIPVTLAAVADIRPDRGPAEIHRIQQSRAAIITGEIAGRNLGAVITDLEHLVRENRPPTGVTFSLAGQNEEMERSFGSLAFALGLAIFLVYLVMASTFENLTHPFIILFTMPLALVGVVIGLLAGGFTLNVISLIGTIFLAGVVVNNAIVLVDAVNRFRRLGLDLRESVVRAGVVRLRPILMTTLTTVLGLLPLAIGFGEGAELRQPLAVVVSFGLVVSTALTLLVIPAVYEMFPSTVRTRAEEEELEAIVAAAERRATDAPGGSSPVEGTT
jgi:HAE1 family hydrophobic/amphiphilic exporter-1